MVDSPDDRLNCRTFRFAKNVGDKYFLYWLRDRLIRVYGVDPGTDFIRVLGDFVDGIEDVVLKAEAIERGGINDVG